MRPISPMKLHRKSCLVMLLAVIPFAMIYTLASFGFLLKLHGAYIQVGGYVLGESDSLGVLDVDVANDSTRSSSLLPLDIDRSNTSSDIDEQLTTALHSSLNGVDMNSHNVQVPLEKDNQRQEHQRDEHTSTNVDHRLDRPKYSPNNPPNQQNEYHGTTMTKLHDQNTKSSIRSNNEERSGADDAKDSASGLEFAFITFSHLSNITDFENTVLASVQTWVPKDSKYYVVLNQKWEAMFNEWRQKYHDDNYLIDIVDRIQPIYVDCPEAKFGESPCCKQQKGLVAFHKTYWTRKHYDWVVYMDDDVYLQANVLEEFITTLPEALPHVKEYMKNQSNPLLLTASIAYRLGRAGYTRTSHYQCSNDESFKYPWGQPVVYNRAAFELIIPGLEMNGLVQQCLEYDVTHDVGNAIFHWMYSIPSARVRSANFKGKKPQFRFRGDTVVYHGAGTGNLSMMMFHRRRTKNVVFSAPGTYYDWLHPMGYRDTETFRQFGSPQEWTEWHTMPTSDCKK